VRTTVRWATRQARSYGWELTEAVGQWRGGQRQRWAAMFRGGGEAPVTGDKVLAVLQMEEGKWKVRRAPMRDNGSAGGAHWEDVSTTAIV
jgi:hypothetical protein